MKVVISKLREIALTPPVCAISMAVGILAFTGGAQAAVVCYDSHATGNDTGEDWANACTNLATALELAGDGGEVRVRQGIHFPIPVATNAAIALPNVRLVGGYTGNGDERSDNPRTTIFSGDIDKTDYYADATGANLGVVLNYETGEFFDFESTPAVGYWEYKPKTQNVAKLFTVADGVTSDYTQTIEGLSFTGYGRGGGEANLIYGGKVAHLVVTNCLFIGNKSYIKQWQPALIDVKCDARILDCKFLGNNGTAIRYFKNTPAVTSVENLISGCEFAYSSAVGENPVTLGYSTYANNSHSKIVKCDFHDLYMKNTAADSASENYVCVVTESTSGNVDVIDGCTFRRIEGVGDVQGLVCLSVAGNHVTNSLFESCRIDARSEPGAAKARTYYDMVYAYKGTVDCAFSNCLMTTTLEGTSTSLVRTGTADGQFFCKNTDFVGCAVTTAVKQACLSAVQCPHYKYGEIKGNSLFGGTNAGLVLNNMTFTQGGEVSGNTVSSGTGYAQISSQINATDVRIFDNRLSTVSGASVRLVNSVTTMRYCSVNGNELSGATSVMMLFAGAGFSIQNCEIFGNVACNAGPNATACLLGVISYSAGGNIAWTKFYGNDFPVGFHVSSLQKAATLGYVSINSSIIARGEGDEPFTPVTYGSADYEPYFNIRFRQTHIQNAVADAKYVDATSTVDGKVQLLTDAPAVYHKVMVADNGHRYLKLFGKSPYRRAGYRPFYRSVADQVIVFEQSPGNWFNVHNLSSYKPTGSEVPLDDLLGAERPEGEVCLGAVQELQKLGLMLLVR